MQPGYQRLDGVQALAWVCFRHDQNGEFTRIVRQQMFLRGMKRELAGSATLTSLPRFLSVASTTAPRARRRRRRRRNPGAGAATDPEPHARPDRERHAAALAVARVSPCGAAPSPGQTTDFPGPPIVREPRCALVKRDAGRPLRVVKSGRSSGRRLVS